MQITINLKTVNDCDTIIEAIKNTRTKFLYFSENVKISCSPADIELWKRTHNKIEILTDVEQQIFDQL